jgi:hypothetical protein
MTMQDYAVFNFKNQNPIKIFTFIGKGNYEEVENIIEDYTIVERVFPVALVKFFREKYPDQKLKVLFFLTEEVREHKNWKELTKPFLKQSNTDYEEIPIPDYLEPSDFIQKMLPYLEIGDNVILDTTFSFRNIPLTAVVASLYLKEAKEVESKIIYGMKIGKKLECKDLTSLIEMAEWLYAVKLFKEYGYGDRFAELVKSINSKIYKFIDKKERKNTPKSLSSFQQNLRNLSTALRLGSIREIKESIRKFIDILDMEEALEEIREYVPMLYPMIPSLKNVYNKFNTGENKIKLDVKELNAERELLKFYIKTNDLGMALRLAREYLINIVLYKEGKADKVLDRKEREKVSIGESDVIRNARNYVAHFGFNEDNLKIVKIIKELEKISEKSPDEIYNEYQKEKATKKALISPLGTTPGALYTVICREKPDILIVISSQEGFKRLDEIIQQSKFKGNCYKILVKDPFKGINEVKNVVEEAKKHLEDVKELVINLTGGTSLLGYMVERVRDKVRYGKEIRTIMAIDRRPYEEQKMNPYVLGDILQVPDD